VQDASVGDAIDAHDRIGTRWRSRFVAAAPAFLAIGRRPPRDF
jgi:hypothetical protein